MKANDSTIREATKVVTAHRQREGAGFIVRRPLPMQGLELADPFLLLDEMGPVDYAPGEAVGASRPACSSSRECPSPNPSPVTDRS